MMIWNHLKIIFDSWCKTNAMMIEDEKISLQRFGFNGNMETRCLRVFDIIL